MQDLRWIGRGSQSIVEAIMGDGTRKVYENVRIHQIFNVSHYFYDEKGKK